MDVSVPANPPRYRRSLVGLGFPPSRAPHAALAVPEMVSISFQRGAPGGGFSVDHPPEEAYQALVAFTRCMGEHHMQMPGPAWEAALSGLSIWPDLRSGLSVSDRGSPRFTRVNGPLMGRRLDHVEG